MVALVLKVSLHPGAGQKNTVAGEQAAALDAAAASSRSMVEAVKFVGSNCSIGFPLSELPGLCMQIARITCQVRVVLGEGADVGVSHELGKSKRVHSID